MRAHKLFRLALALAERKAIADRENQNERLRLCVTELTFAAGWVDALRDLHLMPGTSRVELNVAAEAIFRGAQYLDRQIFDCEHRL